MALTLYHLPKIWVQWTGGFDQRTTMCRWITHYRKGLCASGNTWPKGMEAYRIWMRNYYRQNVLNRTNSSAYLLLSVLPTTRSLLSTLCRLDVSTMVSPSLLDLHVRRKLNNTCVNYRSLFIQPTCVRFILRVNSVFVLNFSCTLVDIYSKQFFSLKPQPV